MNCCQTIRPVWGDIEPATFPANTMQTRSATVMAYLTALVTPEPSGEAEFVPQLPPGRLFGAFKASFWALAAVGLGILLALVCN
jgi:hypothetical protein